MFGLMKKDLLLIKNNKNTILIAIIMVLFFCIFGQMDISYILPFMLLTVYMSSFSYDEYNNFNSYVCTLPNGRENVVNAKYLLTIILNISVLILCFIITLLTSETSLKEGLFVLTCTNFFFFLMISILYPLLFKYGAEKGKIILLTIALAIGGIAALLMNNLKLDSNSTLVKFADSYGLPFMIIVSVIALITSYFISKRIYLNKEF